MTDETLPMPACLQCGQPATHVALGAMVRMMYDDDCVWMCAREARVIALLAERFGQGVEVMPRWAHHVRASLQR